MILLISCYIAYINNIVIVNSKVFVVRIDIDNGVWRCIDNVDYYLHAYRPWSWYVVIEDNGMISILKVNRSTVLGTTTKLITLLLILIYCIFNCKLCL